MLSNQAAMQMPAYPSTSLQCVTYAFEQPTCAVQVSSTSVAPLLDGKQASACQYSCRVVHVAWDQGKSKLSRSKLCVCRFCCFFSAWMGWMSACTACTCKSMEMTAPHPTKSGSTCHTLTLSSISGQRLRLLVSNCNTLSVGILLCECCL